MDYIALPEAAPRPLHFFLAMEEFIAGEVAPRCSGGEAFFMWQVDPTVIIGRNQMLECEVDTAFCRRGIDIVRRKSGGGCVFADRNNIMFSYVTPAPRVQTAFDSYNRRVTDMLRLLGIDAGYNSRNDILIGGRKVAGNAFYRTRGHSIVHGTMLYDADLDSMTRALTPAAEKLRSKGVESVRSRVTTVRSHRPDISLDEFKAHARRTLCGESTLTLTEADVAAIERLAEHYLSPGWLTGNNPRGTLLAEARIEGAGQFRVAGELESGRIRSLDLKGDFLITGDIGRDILEPLAGCEFSPEAVGAALAGRDLSETIAGLTADAFTALLFGQPS